MSFLPPNWTDATEDELSHHITLLNHKECEYAAVLAQQKEDKLNYKLGHARGRLKRYKKSGKGIQREAAAKDVAALEEAIDTANANFDGARHAAATLVARRNHLQNNQNGFLALPDEILLRILSVAQNKNWEYRLAPGCSGTQYPRPVELISLLVCRDLNKLALRTDFLWRCIGFFASHKCSRLEMYLQRSQGGPVDIAIQVKSEHNDQFKPGDRLPLLIPHLDRLRSLVIHSDSQCGLKVLSRSLHQLSAPNLLELDVALEMDYEQQAREIDEPWSYPESSEDEEENEEGDVAPSKTLKPPKDDSKYLRLFHQAPRLKFACLTNTYFNPKDSLVAHLDTIDLRHYNWYIPDNHVDDEILFSGCQTKLRYLIINRDAIGWRSDEENLFAGKEKNIVTLPNLQSLVIASPLRGTSDSVIGAIGSVNVLVLLRAPSITTLAINLRVPAAEWEHDHPDPLSLYLGHLAKWWPELKSLEKFLLICDTPEDDVPVKVSDWAIDGHSPLQNVKELFVVGDLRTQVLQGVLTSVPAATHLTLAGAPIDPAELQELVGRPDAAVKRLKLVEVSNADEVKSARLDGIEVEIDARATAECVDEFLDFRFQSATFLDVDTYNNGRD